MKTFQIRKLPAGRYGDAVAAQNLEAALRAALRLMRGPLAQYDHRTQTGPPKPKGEAVHVAATQVPTRHAGFILDLRNSRDKGVRIRVGELEPAETTGNYLVDQLFAWLGMFGPGLVNLGAEVNKCIGSGTFPDCPSGASQHACYKPLADWKRWGFPTTTSSTGANAIDWAFMTDGRYDADRTDRSFYEAIDNADALHLQNLIHWPTAYKASPYPLIWNPEGGLHRYIVPPGGSDHSTHGHGDVRPTRDRTFC